MAKVTLQHRLGRREGQTPSPNSRPDATAGFPQRRFTAKEAETPAGAGREGRGIAAPNAPSGQPDPTKAGEPGLHAPSPPRPESRTRETPLPVPHTPRARSKAAPRPHPHRGEGRGRSRGYLARARPAPFSTTARAPAPPLIGGTRARPSVRTGTTLSSPSRTECGPAPPPTATHGKPRLQCYWRAESTSSHLIGESRISLPTAAPATGLTNRLPPPPVTALEGYLWFSRSPRKIKCWRAPVNPTLMGEMRGREGITVRKPRSHLAWNIQHGRQTTYLIKVQGERHQMKQHMSVIPTLEKWKEDVEEAQRISTRTVMFQ
nr:skin secretory protein xP2-like [Peromyscus maniculatus bairdii]